MPTLAASSTGNAEFPPERFPFAVVDVGVRPSRHDE
jgi:hypothetical protein